MPCTVCQHPDCQAIDQALLSRTATLAQLSEQYHLSISALHRHKQHLQKKMARLQVRFQDVLNEGCLMILNSFLEMTFQVSRTAQAEGNTRLVLQAARQGTAIMKFMHKLGFPLTQETLHRLLSAPDLAGQGTLLPTDPQIFLGSRQTLAHCLASPCPEPGSDQDKALDAGLTDLSNLNADQLLYLLTELDPSLGAGDCEPKAAKREKGGKLPGKFPLKTINNQENQIYAQLEKIAGIMDQPLLSRHAPPSLGHSKLETLFQEGISANIPLSEYIYEQSLKNCQEKKNGGNRNPAQA